MSRLVYWDNLVQYGRGVGANVVGQSYSVYHLGPTTSGGIETGAPLFGPGGTISTNYLQASITKAKRAHVVENTTFELLTFEAIVDNRKLSLGDVLVETGYEGTGSNYVVAQRRPMRPTVLVRSEQNISISRPTPLGGAAQQQPASGNLFNAAYGGTTKGSEYVLTLTNGLYSFVSSGSPASIPCGIQPQNKLRSYHGLQFPTNIQREYFVAYLPMLPGVQIWEADVLNLSNADRYMVMQPYTSSQIGLVGWILIC